MLTQCPECKTVFRVRPEQLQAAGGKVRCSRCHTVFNAAEQRFIPEQEVNTPARSDHESKPAKPEPREHPRHAIRKSESKTEIPSGTGPKPTPRQKPRISPLNTTDTTDLTAQRFEAPPDGGIDETAIAGTVTQATSSASSSESGSDTAQPDSEPLSDHTPSPREEEPVGGSTLTEGVTTETDELPADEIEQESAPEAPSKDEQNSTIASPAGGDTPETSEHAEEPESDEEATPQALMDTPVTQPAAATAGETGTSYRDEEAEQGNAAERPRTDDEESSPQEETEELPSLSTSDAEELLETMRKNLSARQTAQADSEPSQEPARSETDTSEPVREKEEKGETSEDEFENSLFDLFAPQEDDSLINRGDEASNSANDEEIDSNWDLFSEQNIETLSSYYERNVKAEPAEESQTTQPDTEQEEEALALANAPVAEEPVPPSPVVAPAETETEELPELPEEDWPTNNEAAETSPLPDKSPEEDEVPPTPTEEPSPPKREAYSLPLQVNQRSGQRLRIALWGSGILLLCATLGLQYLYFFRDNLVENTTVRPLLSQMCQLTGCQLPPRRAVDKITLVDHLVQSHPRYRNSLLITATLMNRANFTQPFPILEVVMTDLQQKVIAHRRFTPEQYLTGGDKNHQFTPNTEIPLMLEVVDPGDAAVGFEFNFY